MKKTFFVFTFIYLLSINSYSSDYRNYKFEHFSIENGLSNTHVQAICEDTKGYLWIGTKYLLNRYDGYEFKQYDREKFDLPDSSVSVNVIADIYETNKGDLFVGTEEGGIFKLNRDLDRFEPYLYGKLASRRIQRILEDKKDSCLWIGYADGKGIEKWRINTDSAKKEFFKPLSYINDIYQDKQGVVWVSCYRGLFKYNEKDNKLDPIPFTKDKTIIAVTELNNEWLLAGSNENGIFVIDGNGKKIDKKEVIKLLGEKIGSIIEKAGIKIKDILRTDDLIWIGTTEGMYCYLIKTKELIRFAPNENQKEWLSHPIITRFGISKKTNVLWIGLLHSGMNKLNMNKPIFTHINKYPPTIFSNSGQGQDALSGNNVNIIFADGENLWIGFESGEVNKLNKNSLIRQPFFPDIETKLLDKSSITGIARDPSGDLLISTWDKGLFSFNKKKKTYSQKFKEDLDKENLWQMMKDSKNRIWIAAHDGVFKIENDSIKKFMLGERCWYVFEDKRNNTVWVGTQNGLVLLDSTAENPNITLIPEDYITFITEAVDKNQLWVATYGGGIYLIDGKEKKVIRCYTDLPNNIVHSLGLDRYQNLWIATNNGLCVIKREELDKKNPEIIIFNESQGIQSMQYQTRTFCKSPDGTLYFGGINGLNIITGEELDSIKKDSIKIMITNFQLFDGKNKKIDEKNKINAIQKAINQNFTINLNHEEQISLHFAVINFISNEEYKYHYSVITGKDTTEWRPMNKSRIVDLNSLASGNYTLRVKAETNDGREPEIKNISLHVSPSKWEIWQTYILILIGIIMGIIISLFIISNKYKNDRKSLHSILESIYKIVIMKDERTINPLVVIQNLVDDIHDEFAHHFKMDYLNIGLLNKEKDKLEFPSVFGKSKYEHSLAEDDCLNYKEEEYIKNYKKECYKQYKVNRIAPEESEEETTSILYLPLKNNRQTIIGVITIQSCKRNAFDVHKRLLFNTVSTYVGETLTKLLNEINAKEKMAITDTCLSILKHDVSPMIKDEIPRALNKLQDTIPTQNVDLSEQGIRVKGLSEKLKQIFSVLSETSLLSAPELPFNKSTFDLRRVFDALQVLENNLKTDIKLVFEQGKPCWVRADRFLVEILLRNLIQNAINHTCEGSISISTSDYGDKFILVSVKDTGEGMSDELKKTIFSVENRAKGENGHGFGLVLCQHIIEKHKDSSIWVTSEIGKGSTFYFTLEKATIHE